jgi:hypothetical protein
MKSTNIKSVIPKKKKTIFQAYHKLLLKIYSIGDSMLVSLTKNG